MQFTDITEILKTIIYLCVLVFSAFGIPFIKKNVDAQKLRQILTYIEIFVTAAEQIFDAADGPSKKAYVVEHVKAFLAKYNLKMDDVELDAAIEAAVLELHAQLVES